MGSNTSRGTWFGGVLDAREYANHGRYRPEVAAWLDELGTVRALRLVPPGEGREALLAALRDECARRRGPARIALQAPELSTRFEPAALGLPVSLERHWGFETCVRDALEEHRPAGLGYEQGYVGNGISVELARELFVASNALLARDMLRTTDPVLCAVSLPSHGYERAAVWIGREDAALGSGLYIFRDLAHYRDFMHVRVVGDVDWAPEDDASALGLTYESLEWAPKALARDVRRHRLPLLADELVPVVVATDEEDVSRPYGADDVERIVLVTQAVTAAFEAGRDGRYDLRAHGVSASSEVWRRHPDARDEDVKLTLMYYDEELLTELRASGDPA